MFRFQRQFRSSSRVVLCVLALCAMAFAQFETRGIFSASYAPHSIAVGDFNGDGNLDLAVAVSCCPDGGVAILLGNGDGTFRPAVYYPAGTAPISVVAADFDNDGNLDLATASESGYISILMGNGDGTFQVATQSPPVPAFEIFVTVGDFNGDGIPDLVSFSDNNPCKCISVLLGKGDGTFQDAVITDPPFVVESIGLGKFNHDGRLDLVTAGNFTINVLLGNGDGTFRYGASYPSDESPASIAVADFNGDHNLDLAIANIAGIAVLMGNGNGTFQTAVEYPTSFPIWVAAADFTGNRTVDLVAANSLFDSGVSVFLGNGDGTFQSPTFYPGGKETEYVAVGDFNGDGKIDIARADYLASGIEVLLNTGVVTFTPTTPLNFTKQAVGSTSAPQTVTLTNTGSTALTISSMKASAEFGVTSTCGKSVAAGGDCTISVTFSPTKQGAQSGTITIIDSASTKPQVIELFGTGT